MDRREAITALVEWRGNLPDLLAAVREFPYDSEVPLLTLRADHIRKVLERYLSGLVSATDLEAWADAIEGRDDIEYFAPHEDELSDVLFRLSTPDINEPISKHRTSATQMIRNEQHSLVHGRRLTPRHVPGLLGYLCPWTVPSGNLTMRWRGP